MSVNNQLNVGSPTVTGQTLQTTSAGALSWGSTPYITFVKDSNGNNMAKFTTVAAAVNYLEFVNEPTGSGPGFYASGSDSNIGININTKGTGAYNFLAGSGTSSVLILNPVASAVNYLAVSNSATGNTPFLLSSGTDTNIGMNIITKGTGIFTVSGSGGTTNMLSASNVANAVNYLATSNAATGDAPSLSVVGSDTNIGMLFNVKGTGGYIFSGNDGINFAIGTSSAGANYIQINNAATANAPSLSVVGTDTNISMNLVTKGTGGVNFFSSAGTSVSFQISAVASAVNNIAVYSSPTANSPTVGAVGSDTNINLLLAPKGTGNVTIQSTNLTQPLVIQSGTALQHSTTFTMANTAANRTFGMPDYNIVWPATQGGAGTKLTNDGSGNLTWT